MHDEVMFKHNVCEEFPCPKALRTVHPPSPLPFLRMLAMLPPPAFDRKSASDDAVAALALASTVDPNCLDLKPPKIDSSVLRLDGDTLKDEQLIVSCGQSVAISPAKRSGGVEGDTVNPKRQKITKNTERILNANELSVMQKHMSSVLTVTFKFKCYTVTLKIGFTSSAGGSSRNSAFRLREKNQNIEASGLQNTIIRVRYCQRFYCIRLQIVQIFSLLFDVIGRFGMQIVKDCLIHESSKPNNAKVILNNSAEILAVFPHLNSEDFRERLGWWFEKSIVMGTSPSYVDHRNQVMIKKCK
jgi:hypothetical protein